MKPKRLADLLILTATAALILGLTWTGAGAIAAAPAPAAQPEAQPETAPSATVALDPVADAYVDSAKPTQNYGGASTLYLGSQTASVIGRALFRFNFSSVPTNAIVDSASLQVYLASTSGTPATLSVGVYRINGDWTEAGVNWKNQPPVTFIHKSNGVGTTPQFYDWDVAGLAQAWIASPTTNFGLELRSESEGSVGWRGFASRESAPTYRPRLMIAYHLPSCSDAQEPNDTFSQAFPVTPAVEYLGCIPTPSDLDYWRFSVNPNTRIRVDLFGLPANYDLYLYSPAQSLLASSTNGGTTDEVVVYDNGPTVSWFYALVRSSGGAFDLHDPYHLKLTLTTLTPTATPSPTGTPTPTSTPTPTTTPAPASIGGRVWHDANRDGAQDADEAGIPHVFLRLLHDNAVLASISTDADGRYVFPLHPEGGRTYRVDIEEQSLPDGYTLTTCCEPLDVTPQPGQDVRDADFGYAPPPPASIGGRVWEDRDGDGRQDAGEDGIDRVRLDLVRGDTVIATDFTDADGYYLFSDLEGGVIYRVDVDETTVPSPLILTTCCDPLIVVPRPGQDVRNADFGYDYPSTPTPTPTPTVSPSNMDLEIDGIEVTQATQCYGDPADLEGCEGGDNAIPLVAHKLTVARVYVYLNKIGPGDAMFQRLEDVQVSLLAWDNATGEMLAGGPLETTIPFVLWGVPLSTLRDYETRTANFLLPDNWTDAAYRSGIDLYAVVTDRAEECPACDDNNTYTLHAVTFHEHGQIHIYPVRIRYTRDNADAIPVSSTALFEKIKKIYPINEQDVAVHLDAERIMRTDHDLTTAEGRSDLLNDLADRYVCYEDDFWACGWTEGHYFGVISTTVPFGPVDAQNPNGKWSGVARLDDCVAVGRQGRRDTAAHEIGHNLGREHASNDHGEGEGGGWEEWPYPHGGIGVVGFDTWNIAAKRLGAVNGLHHHDIMSYGYGLGKWVSPRTYLALYDNYDFCSSASPAVPGARAQQAAQPATYWLVAGRLQPTVAVRPIFRVTAILDTIPPGDTGRYTLELQDAGGAVLASRHFDPLEEEGPENADQDVRPFRQYLPDAPGAARLVLKDGNAVLLTREMSAHAPSVTVTQPGMGTSWAAAGTGAIRWSASDADGDPLTYVVMYSRDGGATWVNLATGLTEMSYDVELETLGGASGRAQIRVLANDGLRTGQGESARFTVARKRPQAQILSPEPNQVVAPKQPLVLAGFGSDREDGLLPGTALVWSDSASGVLGSGEELTLRDLAAGPHTITLTASDSDGNRAVASVTIYVGYQLWLPFIRG